MLTCRRLLLKAIFIHFIAFQVTDAAPVIRFPGDDSPRTDKEVALVSLFFPKVGRAATNWVDSLVIVCTVFVLFEYVE